MLEALFSIFKGAKFGCFTSTIRLIEPLLLDLEENYVKDKDAKNALIDTLIQVLQSHKDLPNG